MQREDTVMKKKEFLAGAALLAASSALCMKIMKKVGEKLKSSRRRGRIQAADNRGCGLTSSGNTIII